MNIFIVNPKGGCGKSTIATQLAGYFATQNKSVSLVDHDPQKSCLDWAKGRPSRVVDIHVIEGRDFAKQIKLQSDFYIHDLPAAWQPMDKGAKALIQPGDKILVPVLPSATDIKACLRFMMQFQREFPFVSEIDVAVVANRVKLNTAYYPILEEFLSRLCFPFLGSIRDSQNYVIAMHKNLTVFELPPSRIQADIDQWKPIIGWAETAGSQPQQQEQARSLGTASVR